VTTASAASVEVEVSPTSADAALALTPAPATLLDEESRLWLHDLHGQGPAHDAAVERLHVLLLRAARFEVGRRRHGHPHLRGDELGEIAIEAADDALMSVLRRLDDFRGDSRFTTWVYKFALLEAAVKLRKRAWQGREIPLEQESWDLLSSAGLGPADAAEQSELSHRTSAASSSRSPSTASRSTCSPTGSTPTAARSTRHCTTHAETCVPT
jgi:DNA-directed RNA polymerase specialized sigma24 family protein